MFALFSDMSHFQKSSLPFKPLLLISKVHEFYKLYTDHLIYEYCNRLIDLYSYVSEILPESDLDIS